MEPQMLIRSAWLMLLTLSCLPCNAAESGTSNIGRGVICSTQQQVEKFVALRGEGRESLVALQEVNEEADGSPACHVQLVVFTDDKPLAQLAVQGRLISIMQITVQALGNGSRWMEIPPTVQYTAAAEKGQFI